MISEPFTIPIDSFDEGEGFAVEVRDPEREERQERDWKIVHWFERSVDIWRAYTARQETSKDKEASFVCWALAMGFPLLAGVTSVAEYATKSGYSKAMLNKAMNHFVEQLALEPLPWQRDKEARKSMSLARKNQLKGKTNGKPWKAAHKEAVEACQ